MLSGIRPEAFEMRAGSHGADVGQRVMSVDVGLVEQLGSEAYVHFTKPIPPVVTSDIEELLEDEGHDVRHLGQETKFTARVNPDLAPSFRNLGRAGRRYDEAAFLRQGVRRSHPLSDPSRI